MPIITASRPVPFYRAVRHDSYGWIVLEDGKLFAVCLENQAAAFTIAQAMNLIRVWLVALSLRPPLSQLEQRAAGDRHPSDGPRHTSN